MRRTARIARCLLASCLALLATSCAKPPQQAAFEMPPTPVEVATVLTRPVADLFTALGSVEAAETIDVVAEIDARVDRMPFTEGGDARKGDVLADLDRSQLAASLARAEAQAEHARSTVRRVESLVGQSIMSPQSQDDVNADLRVAEADVALARARLDKTVIRAPFAGVVGARRVSTGAYLHAGDVITELSQQDEIKVRFSVPERYLFELHAGSSVAITSPAWPGAPLSGSVTLVEPVLDSSTRSARVTARAANPERRFRPGMSADVAVTLAERAEALTIPSEAVFYQGTQALVYLVSDDNTVAQTPVTLGTRLSDAVEVTAGLSAGQRVVSAGHQKLYPGAKVMAVGAGAPETGSGDKGANGNGARG